MPGIDEKTKRELREAMEMAASNEERKKLAAAAAVAAAPATSKKHAESKSGITFRPTTPAATPNKDWQKIVDDYTKRFKLKPDEKTGALVFATREDAFDFFTTQAKLGREFLVTEYVNGEAIDFHVFSCGDMHLYKGTYADIKLELENTIKAQPENQHAASGLKNLIALMPAPSAVSEMREKMKGHRAVEQDEHQAEPAPAPTRR